MYQFVVDFIGQVPTEFTFIYTILTLIISISIFGAFMSFPYFALHLLRGDK